MVPGGTRDPTPVVADLPAHGSDASFHAGDQAGATRVARTLAATPYEGPRMAMHTAMGARFPKDAGDAAEGWEFVSPCVGAAAPAAKEFAAAHRKKCDGAPARWAAEAYDAVGLTADAARDTSATGAEREGIAQRLFRTTHPGITRTVSFYANRQVRYETGIHLYRVENGRARFLGPYTEV
ncbi:ABC transporter substrate-binding protein [Streptomyces sp. NPDC102437]|uniref:ABC transporter substrate-binding protein n=1 Tax=Streptomyces sp. NPDC102437 TaxID=3366175 RepID=UPI0037F35A23